MVSDITVLCVDDEKYITDSIKDFISDEYRCLAYSNPLKALQFLRNNPVEILIVDYRMPGLSGLELLTEARRSDSYQTGLLLTAYADKELLKDVLNNSLVERAIEKPLNLDFLKSVIDAASRKIIVSREQNEKLQDIYKLMAACGETDFTFIGKDGDLADLWEKVKRTAPTDENVLITGETGTGKDVLARQIHALSGRSDGPFIKINCGAIPPQLIESELFGHERGAFSGAEKRKFGKIELSHKGTLFLDEIGELPLELQSRLLHVVEDKAVERVGGTEAVAVDFRLISATNRELDTLLKTEFRRDLFFRLSTIHLKLPELRDRPNDMPLLIFSLMKKAARLYGKPSIDITSDALNLLCSCRWPGNIRELDNVLKRAVLMKKEGDLMLAGSDFGLYPDSEDPVHDSYSNALAHIAAEMAAGGRSIQSVEKALLEKVVELCGGKTMEAVRRTGIPKDRFYRLRDCPKG